MMECVQVALREKKKPRVMLTSDRELRSLTDRGDCFWSAIGLQIFLWLMFKDMMVD